MQVVGTIQYWMMLLLEWALPHLFLTTHAYFLMERAPKQERMGEKWAIIAEEHLLNRLRCSSGLCGPTLVSVSVQRAFIQHSTVFGKWSSLYWMHPSVHVYRFTGQLLHLNVWVKETVLCFLISGYIVHELYWDWRHWEGIVGRTGSVM